jgi:AcrR family transcriptional regulator
MTTHTTSTPTRRLQPDDRVTDLLTVALQVARTEGFNALTRKRVAQAASVSPGLVTHRFLSTDLMRDAVMTEAVRVADLRVVADGIALRHVGALAAPLEMQQAAIAELGCVGVLTGMQVAETVQVAG